MVRTVGIAPGFLLLPAQEYEWEVKQKVEIRLPRRGKISDLSGPTYLVGNTPFSTEDDFSVYEDNLVLFWELIRVLFAQSQYPALEPDECLAVVALQFSEDEVIVHGEVIKNV